MYVPFKTVNDAVEDLTCGKSDYAVIPQENTIGGVVTDYLDTLISHVDLSVVGEIELPINHNLLVHHGAMLCDIKKVYSHNQGITQVKNWLDEYLSGVEIIEVSSTAEGARIVSESNDISCAVIASLVCSDLYDLDVLATGIQNNDSNKTRFYVLYREKPATISSDRIAFVANGMAKDLPVLMTEIEKQNMTLIAIHDRPQITELGWYYYLIECSEGDYERYEKLTEKSLLEFRYLGSFCVQ